MPHVNLTAKQEAFCQGIADGLGHFYVYALIDERNGETFYIGKGSGKRSSQHLRDARNGRVCNDAKHQRICEIIDAGSSVIDEILFLNLSEDAALKIEKHLISEYRDKIVNISGGNGPRGSAIGRDAIRLLEAIQPKEIWIKGWHPDCIKGFGGIENAIAFYDDMISTLSKMAEKVMGYEQRA